MMRRLSRDRGASDSGSAAVELAVALPLLVLILAATIDFSRVFHIAMALTDAARAGAQYGAANTANSVNTATMQTTATGATSVSGISANAARICRCATDTGTFSDTSGTVNDCTTAEATACPGGHRVMMVTVTTTKTFSTIFTSVLPGAASSITLTRTATLRVSQ